MSQEMFFSEYMTAVSLRMETPLVVHITWRSVISTQHNISTPQTQDQGAWDGHPAILKLLDIIKEPLVGSWIWLCEQIQKTPYGKGRCPWGDLRMLIFLNTCILLCYSASKVPGITNYFLAGDKNVTFSKRATADVHTCPLVVIILYFW